MNREWRLSSCVGDTMKPGAKDPNWLQSVLKSIGDGIVAADKGGLISNITPVAETLMDAPHEQAVGRPLSELLMLLDPKTRKPLSIPAPTSFQKSKKPRSYNRAILVSHSHRKETLVEAVFSPIEGYRGGIAGCVLVLRDIGKTLLHEHEMLHRQKIRAICNIAVSIAQEYNNRLAVIAGQVSLIADNLTPKTRPHDAALKIIKNVEYADALTKRLLSVEKAGRSDGEMKFEPQTRPGGKKDQIKSNGETILLVDDKKDMLIETRKMLARAGYKVHTASNGKECVSLYKKHAREISLSIIDAMMPGEAGKRALNAILQHDPTASIIMTSGFSRDYIRGYLERGAWGFLQKPLDEDQLLGTVRQTLDQEGRRRGTEADTATL